MENLAQLDCSEDTKNIQNHMNEKFQAFMEQYSIDNKIEDKNRNLVINLFQQKFKYEIPRLEHLSYIEGQFCCKEMFESFNFDNFVFLMCSIFHERSIVFVSQNQRSISVNM